MSGPLPIKHLAIAASAGAGKTHQLVTRYIGLLLNGASPAGIVALTFSRKAGGEILDSLVSRLAGAAAPEGGDKALAALDGDLRGGGYLRTGEQLTVETAGELLRTVIQSLHLARIGTLDSFFISILRAFPFEFDIGGDFDIMSDYDADCARLEALMRVFLDGTPASARLLYTQFRQALFGRDEFKVFSPLNDFITKRYAIFQLAPRQRCWGDAAAIWPERSPWPAVSVEEAAAAADRLRRLPADKQLKDDNRLKWEEFLAAAVAHQTGGTVGKALEYFLKKLLPRQAELRAGGLELNTFRQKYTLAEEECEALQVLLNRVCHNVVSGVLRQTQGTHALLQAYEASYDQLVRRQGRLTFQDVLYLLNPGDSGAEPYSTDRLNLDYRLDAMLNHWLLDEFQDTSTSQWLPLANLIDEVLQDSEGGRSLFYVGDVKQAIYNWRGGNSELFSQVLERYNAATTRIEQLPLSKSWRSSQPVIDAVNQVFRNLPGAQGLPRAAVQRWEQAWAEHSTEREDYPGCVELHVVPAPARGGKAQAGCFATTLHLLREIDPGRRGLDCAVLVRRNETGRQLVDFLREAGLPAVWEGEQPVVESLLVLAFRSLIKAAFFAEDTLAWEYLRMTPFGTILQQRYGGKRSEAAAAVRRLVARTGYAGLILTWRDWLEEGTAWGRAEATQAGALLEAALEFDRSEASGPLDFIKYTDQYRSRTPGAGEAIRVTTLHQAKGLQYDLVVLPELHQDIRDKDTILVGTDPATPLQPDWVLIKPQSDIAAADPVLALQLDRLQVERWYEQLCLLYVGMTRAVYGLYLVVPARGPSSKAARLSTVLLDTLAAAPSGEEAATLAWRTGDPDWYKQELPQPTPRPPAAEQWELNFETTGTPHRLERITPAGTVIFEQEAASLFRAETGRAVQTGAALHDLLEQVDWLDACDTKAICAEWRRHSGLPDELAAEVEAHFENLISTPAARQLLSHPAPGTELWREWSFELAHDHEWISGRFDRVTLECDTNGDPVSATIIDYKSNRVETAAEREQLLETYRSQMQLYRRALQQLTGLPPERIELIILLTASGEIVKVN